MPLNEISADADERARTRSPSPRSDVPDDEQRVPARTRKRKTRGEESADADERARTISPSPRSDVPDDKQLVHARKEILAATDSVAHPPQKKQKKRKADNGTTRNIPAPKVQASVPPMASGLPRVGLDHIGPPSPFCSCRMVSGGSCPHWPPESTLLL